MHVGVLTGKGVIVVDGEHSSVDYQINIFRERTIDARGVLVTTPPIVRAIIHHGTVQLEDDTRLDIPATRWDARGFINFDIHREIIPGIHLRSDAVT